MPNPSMSAALLLTLSMLVAASAARSASFFGLGDLPGGAFSSKASAISDDGAVVVGAGNYSATGDLVVFANGEDPNTEAFRWESSTGMVGLGFPVSDNPSRFSAANGVSADGTVIVGSSLEGGFRWDESDGLIAFQYLANVVDVSASGGAIAANSVLGPNGLEAVRWDSNSFISLGSLPGRVGSIAHGISSDGAVIVGSTAFSQGRAFRWDADDGMIDLGDLPGHTDSIVAHHASADGSVIVGWGTSEPDSTGGRISSEAFRWDAQTGIAGLGFLGGSGFSMARDVSADGSVIVGEAEVENVRVAFVWDAEHGMRRLDEVLETLGVNLTGWSLGSATGISADGSTIVGIGNGPNGVEAWIAVIPEPGSTILLGFGLAIVSCKRPRLSSSSGGG